MFNQPIYNRLCVARENNSLPEFMAWARHNATADEALCILYSGEADFYTLIYQWEFEDCKFDIVDVFDEANPYVKGLQREPEFLEIMRRLMPDIFNNCPKTCWKLIEIPKVGRILGKEMLSIVASKPYESRREELIDNLLSLDASMSDPDPEDIITVDNSPVVLYPRAHKLFHREIAKLCTPRQLCLLVRNVATLCFEQNPSELKTRTCAVLRAAGQIS